MVSSFTAAFFLRRIQLLRSRKLWLQRQHRCGYCNPDRIWGIPGETRPHVGGAGNEHGGAGVVDPQLINHQVSHGVDGHFGGGLHGFPFAGGHYLVFRGHDRTVQFQAILNGDPESRVESAFHG